MGAKRELREQLKFSREQRSGAFEYIRRVAESRGEPGGASVGPYGGFLCDSTFGSAVSAVRRLITGREALRAELVSLLEEKEAFGRIFDEYVAELTELRATRMEQDRPAEAAHADAKLRALIELRLRANETQAPNTDSAVLRAGDVVSFEVNLGPGLVT